MTRAGEVREPIAPDSLTAVDTRVPFLKGHGTENDFVLIPDRAGSIEISADQVRALCDRRAGIGADGVIRIAPSTDGDGFFMDYRNADGSLAEMCGNGARVFAKFLYDEGWVAERRPFTFGTRGGRRQARLAAQGEICVEMGPALVGSSASTRALLLDGSSQTFAGVAVNVGNPHLVVFTDVQLADLDLTTAPHYSSAEFIDGVNIEFVRVLGPDAVRMRVFERGVGETRSCGTGTVAVAAAHLAATGRTAGTVEVAVPGGVVTVSIDGSDSTLTGPAVMVGTGWIDPEWWARQQ